MVLDFEKEKLIRELKLKKPKKILIQLPEGIKKNALEISKIVEGLGIRCIISGETAWGGCSIAIQEAKALGVDLIVHFGHAEFIKTNFPTVYIKMKDILDLKPLLERSLKELKKYKKIGFSYSIQNQHEVKDIKNFYEQKGKKLILSEKVGLVEGKGHIIGCQYGGLKKIESKVDCFLVLGNRFHSIGASLAVKKPVILLDVYNQEVSEMDDIKDKILKQRAFSIEKLKEAKKVGIISEIKSGQIFGSAEILLKKIKKYGKEGIIITMSEITPEKIMNFYDIEAFVELACPRIAIDDFHKYHKPILTLKEALVALGEKSWEELLEEGIL
ncbi:diphthamide biosynthesis enzyme Dph2 [Patescibacteria group bacterium]|nr:diphthamide biosynthesis enzyme Dph2 [Patescibacteria group bacterium]